MKVRVEFTEKCNTPNDVIRNNILMSMCYPSVQWAVPHLPYCAVVGGGPSLNQFIPVLKEWIGDIFAINDTASYLSSYGIPSYMFTIDCAEKLIPSGLKVRGAVLASRCHPNQFIYKDIRTFNLLGEGPNGVEGGPSTVTRAPHLFMRMGYRGICFFGIDSCYFSQSHVTGTTKESIDQLMIVRVNEIDYVTSAPLYLQVKDMYPKFLKYDFLINTSGGLMKAMIESNGEHQVVGLSEGIRNQLNDEGKNLWNVNYKQAMDRIYKPDEAARV